MLAVLSRPHIGRMWVVFLVVQRFIAYNRVLKTERRKLPVLFVHGDAPSNVRTMRVRLRLMRAICLRGTSKKQSTQAGHASLIGEFFGADGRRDLGDVSMSFSWYSQPPRRGCGNLSGP